MYYAKLKEYSDVAAFQTEQSRDIWVSSECDKTAYTEADDPYFQREPLTREDAEVLTGIDDLENAELSPDVYGCQWVVH